MEDVQITPTLTARRQTECSESLIPPLELESTNHTNDTIQIKWYHFYLFYAWIILWLTVVIVQFIVYVKVWRTIHQIKDVIHDIKDVKHDWEEIKYAFCRIFFIPSICSEPLL